MTSQQRKEVGLPGGHASHEPPRRKQRPAAPSALAPQAATPTRRHRLLAAFRLELV